jgi:hypothetical protein
MKNKIFVAATTIAATAPSIRRNPGTQYNRSRRRISCTPQRCRRPGM